MNRGRGGYSSPRCVLQRPLPQEEQRKKREEEIRILLEKFWDLSCKMSKEERPFLSEYLKKKEKRTEKEEKTLRRLDYLLREVHVDNQDGLRKMWLRQDKRQEGRNQKPE